MWEIPNHNLISVKPEIWTKESCCHWNVEQQVKLIGGKSIKGCYLLYSKIFNQYQLVSHSVWEFNEELIDITPFNDNRKVNSFLPIEISYKNIYSCEVLDIINNFIFLKKDTEMSYYVYGLLDPITKIPFYVGKGIRDRDISHFSEKEILRYKNRSNKKIHCRKMDKIISLQEKNLLPDVVKYAENIESETVAYQFEKNIIEQYGRKDIDESGILLNVCLGNNPPSLKGRTYIEIYGEDKARDLIERKRAHQLSVGGYGPKKFSDETKRKLSEQRKGKLNSRYGIKVAGTDVARKIGDANRGKKVYKKSKLFVIHNHLENTLTFIYMNNLSKYCIKNNYSHGTFHAQLALGRGLPKYGKNVGLLIREATELEKEKYSEQAKISEIKVNCNGEENE